MITSSIRESLKEKYKDDETIGSYVLLMTVEAESKAYNSGFFKGIIVGALIPTIFIGILLLWKL